MASTQELIVEKEETTSSVELKDVKSLLKIPFYEACDAGDIETVREYLQKFSVSELEKMVDQLGWSGLHYAARSGQKEVVLELLAHNFTIDLIDKSGSTPLYRATGFGHNEIVFLLVEKGANPLHTNNQGDNMIHNSAWASNAELTNFFIERGVDVLQKNKSNRIALQDITDKLPAIAARIFSKRRRVISSYLLEIQVEYDFEGIDDQEPSIVESTPLEIILENNHLDLLSEPVIKTLLSLKWEAFAKKLFLRQISLYVFILILYSFVAISAAQLNIFLNVYNSPYNYARAACEAIVFLFAVYALYGELQEYIGAGSQILDIDGYGFLRKRFLLLLFKRTTNPMLVTSTSIIVPRYLFDQWNYFDLVTYFLIVAAGILRAITCAIEAPYVEFHEWQIMAMISIFLWVKLLQLMGVSKITGPLIRTVLRMLIDFAQFLIVYILFWMGFSVGFYVLLAPSGLQAYQNFGLAVVSTFRMTVGDFDWDGMYETTPTPLVQILFVVFVFISNILLLNLLIAMLSNTFDRIKYVAEQEWMMEWASVIMRIQRGLGKKETKRIMLEAFKQQKKSNYTVQNFSPQARVAESTKYTRWEPRDQKDEEPEVNLQILRADIHGLMTQQFQLLKEENKVLVDKLTELEKKINERSQKE